MPALRILALAFAGLVGYSAGNVLRATRANPAPSLWDLPLLMLVWATMVLLRQVFGPWWAVAIGAFVGCLLGLVASVARGTPREITTDVTGALRPWTRSEPKTVTPWRGFATRLGAFQGRLIMTLFYFAVLAPFALVAKLGSARSRRGQPAWVLRSRRRAELKQARRQF